MFCVPLVVSCSGYCLLRHSSPSRLFVTLVLFFNYGVSLHDTGNSPYSISNNQHQLPHQPARLILIAHSSPHANPHQPSKWLRTSSAPQQCLCGMSSLAGWPRDAQCSLAHSSLLPEHPHSTLRLILGPIQQTCAAHIEPRKLQTITLETNATRPCARPCTTSRCCSAAIYALS